MKNLISKNISWKNVIWELLVVFIGLLSALYVDSLIEQRKDNKQEHIYLSEIKNNIESDIEKLDEVLEGMQNDFKNIQELNKAIHAGTIQKDSLVKYFGRLIFIKEFYPNFTALDVINNKGDMGIMKNHQLLYKLNTLQKYSHNLERSTNEVKAYYANRIEPFMLQHFDLKDYVWNDTVTVNAKKLIEDPYFQNLILLSVQKWGTQLQFHKYYREKLGELVQML